MKLFKLSILAVGLCFFAACGDDEDTCLQADWVGTYTGTVTCDGTTVNNATITITASGADAISITFPEAGGTSTVDDIAVNGCNINISGSVGGISATTEASLNGDNLTFESVIDFGGGTPNTCNITATRN